MRTLAAVTRISGWTVAIIFALLWLDLMNR